MKKFLIYVIVALTFIAGSCKKDSDGAPATKMSCKIGGTTWSSTFRVTQFYDNKFSITGTSLDGKIINIIINGKTQNTYQLGIGQLGFVATYKASATTSAEDVYTALTGTVVLTKVDAANKKISGTFQFSAYKPTDILSANPLNVTEGVFSELEYIEIVN
jgi:hypothetical protein